jgi:hypothetical protein
MHTQGRLIPIHGDTTNLTWILWHLLIYSDVRMISQPLWKVKQTQTLLTNSAVTLANRTMVDRHLRLPEVNMEI